jgi:3-oxoadipate enol-lactonase
MTRVCVLSGSLGTDAAVWDRQASALEAAGFRVVRLDHPGHGGEPLAKVESMRDLARHALARVDADVFSFVGLSLGGAVGLQLVLDVPERVDRLAVACTSRRFGTPEAWRERARTVRAEGLEAVADAQLQRWFTPRFPHVQRYRRMLLSTDPEGYARCCDALAGWDVRGELAGVQSPTLAVAADHDPATPPADVQAIADEVPGARLETIANARHLPNVERPDEFNRLLLEHLT